MPTRPRRARLLAAVALVGAFTALALQPGPAAPRDLPPDGGAARGTGGSASPGLPAPRPVIEVHSRYGPDPENVLILEVPAGNSAVGPTVLYLHGGAWQRSQPSATDIAFGRGLASRYGWRVALMSYPTARMPHYAVEDAAVATAVASLARRPQLGAGHVALWGSSAGGQLALLTAYRDAAEGRHSVCAVVSVSAPTDMRVEYHSRAERLLGAVSYYEGESPAASARLGDRRYTATSPLDNVGRDSPPTFQAISLGDSLVPAGQVEELDQRLAVNGVGHQLVELPGVAHGTAVESRRPPGSAATVAELAAGFVQRQPAC